MKEFIFLKSQEFIFSLRIFSKFPSLKSFSKFVLSHFKTSNFVKVIFFTDSFFTVFEFFANSILVFFISFAVFVSGIFFSFFQISFSVQKNFLFKEEKNQSFSLFFTLFSHIIFLLKNIFFYFIKKNKKNKLN